MLVLKDIRACFALDLGDKILGVSNVLSHPFAPTLKSSKNKKDYIFNPKIPHFNSGFMLINLQKWRAFKTQEKMLWILQNYYQGGVPDEILLNAVIKPYLRLTLPISFNFYIGTAEVGSQWADETRSFNYEDIKKARQNTLVWHFICVDKPWQKPLSSNFNNDFLLFKYYALWWGVLFIRLFLGRSF